MGRRRNESDLILGFRKREKQSDDEVDRYEYVAIDEKVRSTHMHVIGASGRGKSKFLEHMIRSDIMEGRGVCLIDPHGHLYHDLLAWCTSRNLIGDDPVWGDRFILIDPSSDDYSFGFNPLDFGSHEIAFGVDAMVNACAQVWGGEDTAATPLLKRCLRATFHALSDQRLTLLEAVKLTTAGGSDHIKKYMSEKLADEVFREQWRLFDEMSPREFREHFMSTNNRILEFLSAPRIRHMIGQRDNVIDFRKAMDERKIILVNLSSGEKLSDDNARLLGTLIVNDLFLRARGRSKKDPPFYLYIDECALFVNQDIRRILDEARKFRLHLILAHQHLNQLKKAGEDVYSAVMTNAQTKVVFGGLTPEDARAMAEMIHMGEFDLEEAKVMFNKPVVIGHIRTWLEAYSKGKGISETDARGYALSTGEAKGSGSGFGSGVGVATPEYSVDVDPSLLLTRTEMTNHMQQDFESFIYGETVSRARAKGVSEFLSESRHETFEPVREILPGKEYSLEEQIHKHMALMINQPMQRAIIKIPLKPSIRVTTPTLGDISKREVVDEDIEETKKKGFERCVFSRRIDDVKQEIWDRNITFESHIDEFIRFNSDVKEIKGTTFSGSSDDAGDDFDVPDLG